MKFDNVDLTISAVRTSQYPEGNLPEFLIVGRSNVGKSSFINTLVNRKNLARVSSKPGKTQTLNFYNIDDMCYIVDVPGYGYAAVSNKKQEKFGLMIEEYIQSRPNLKHVFLLIDYRHKPTENDLLMYDFLKYYNASVTVVCTKYDKVNKSQRTRQDKMIASSLDIDMKDNIVNFSKITRYGREEIVNIMNKVIAENKSPNVSN